MNGVVTLEPAKCVGQSPAGMRQHESYSGETGQMPGKQQPGNGNCRISEPPDGVYQIEVCETLIAADVMRVQEDRRLASRGDLPERVKPWIVKVAADALRL